jgi:hypothetical protein
LLAEIDSNESNDGVLIAFGALQWTCKAHYAEADKNTQLANQSYSVIVSNL